MAAAEPAQPLPPPAAGEEAFEPPPAVDEGAEVRMALTRAVQLDDVDGVRRLLDSDSTLLQAVGAQPGSRTPLMLASCSGSVSMVQLLVSRGACVEKASVCGWSPLRWACANGQAGVASVLLSAGARSQVRDYNGWTPLMHAAACGHLQVVRALLTHHRNSQPSSSWREEPNYRGEMSLHRACVGGHAMVAWELLVEGVADPQVVNRDGKTARTLAMEKGHQQCVDAIDFFNQEVERAYVLDRVRAMVDDAEVVNKAAIKAKATREETRRAARLAATPVHLMGRVEKGEELPVVVMEGGEGVGGGRGGKRRRTMMTTASGDAAEEKEVEARGRAASSSSMAVTTTTKEVMLCGEVARYVMWGMNTDVYGELASFMQVVRTPTTTTN